MPRPALGLVIAVIAFLAFWPAIDGGFSDFDDHGVLVETTGWRGLSPTNLEWMFTTAHMGHYQPLTWLSYAVDHALWGMNPEGYHVTNLLFHSINAVLVFVVALRLFDAARAPGAPAGRVAENFGAFAGAALFAVHPLRVESVAWITERRDVLSTCLLLISVLAYLRAFAPRELAVTNRRWYAASVAVLLLSLLAKPWGMTFFAVALVLDWYPLRRLPARPWLWVRREQLPVLIQKIPYLMLGLTFAATGAWAQHSSPFTTRSLEQWGIVERAVQGAYGLFFYLWKTVAPVRLSPLYELPARIDPFESRFVIAYIVLAAIIAAVVLRARRWPGLAAAALAYAIIVSPVLGILQSGIQLVADRYSYVACIAWAIIAGYGVAILWSRWTRAGDRRALASLLAIVIVVLGAMTWFQTRIWRGSDLLWRHALAVGQDGALIRHFRGRQIEKEGDIEGALKAYRLSVEMNPEYGDGWLAAGSALKELGRFAEAEAVYQTATRCSPDATRAWVALGYLYILHLNRPADAVAALEKAVVELERHGNRQKTGLPYLLLGAAYGETGNYADARRLLSRAATFEDTREKALGHLQEMDAAGL